MPSPPEALLELLPLHAMGVLDAHEAAEVERALALHPALRCELAQWQDAITALGDGATPVVPAAALRARLLASLDGTGDGGPARFAAQVAELFDLDVAAARAVLARIDDASAWRPLLPGIERLAVTAGPRVVGQACNLVRIAPGTRFPWHRHTGEEVSLVLHGGAHVSDGRDLRPGEVMVANEDVEHDFVVDDEGDACVFAVRMHGILPLPRPR